MILCCQSSFLPLSHVIFADDRTGRDLSSPPEIRATQTHLSAQWEHQSCIYLFWERSSHPSHLTCLGQDPTREKTTLYSDGWGQFRTVHLHRCRFSSVNWRHSWPCALMASCWWWETVTAEQKWVTNCIMDQLVNLTLLLFWGEWKADPLWNDPFWWGEVIGKMIFPPSEAVTQPWKLL